MGEVTKIQWCDHTFNAWRGCSEVHPGCDNCYAREMAKRNPTMLGEWGPDGTRVVAAEAMWRQPLRWDRQAAKDGVRRRVFCESLSDVFEDWNGPMHTGRSDEVLVEPDNHVDARPERWESYDLASVKCDESFRFVNMQDVRNRLFRLIDQTRHLDWLLVTKRPENVRRMWPAFLPEASGHLCDAAPHRTNTWLLTSVSDQQTANAMIPELLKCRDLVPVLGLSIEPMLGPIDLRTIRHDGAVFNSVELTCCPFDGADRNPNGCDGLGCNGVKLDWVIVGGESGPRARPCHVEWVQSIVKQCQVAKVSVFVKQLGGSIIDRNDAGFLSEWDDGVGWSESVGVEEHIDGHLTEYQGAPVRVRTKDKKGGNEKEWPSDLRIREFPEVRA